VRYPYGFAVQVPFLDTESDGTVTKNYALVSSNDDLDRRRVKRILSQWAKAYLHRTLRTREKLALMTIVKVHKEPMQYFFRKTSSPLETDIISTMHEVKGATKDLFDRDPTYQRVSDKV